MPAKKTSRRPILWIAAIAILAVGAWALGPGNWFGEHGTVKLRGQRVQRGPLDISVVQRGNLAARDSLSVVSEIEGNTTVLYLIKEGSFVKEGDLLVELDGSALVERKVGQEIAVQNADAAYKKAKAQYDIQASQNKSDIEAAERKLTFANIDLNKYVEGDLDQLQKTAEQKIQLAEAEKKQAETTLSWSTRLNEKGFLTKSELDRDQLAMDRAAVNLEQAVLARTILEKYEDPRKRAELDANVEEAKRGLERSKLRAAAQIADVDANLKSCDAKLKLETEKLVKYVQQLEKTKIVSTATGMVVYTRQEGRMGNDQPMQEGSQVRERQEILQIPREGGMIVEASVHESVLKQVTIGKPCTIRVDSQPGKEFFGHVSFVALLPDKGSWWANPNLRLYKTEITIDRAAPGSEDTIKELRPGMSCAISILSDSVADALYVPLQSVFVDKGETIVFVAHDGDHERRVVKVGRSNEKFVEIVDGLKEGEEVLLSAPPGFAPSGSDDKKDVTKPGGPGAPGPNAPNANAPGGAMPNAMLPNGGASDPSAMHGGEAGADPSSPNGRRGMNGGGPGGRRNREGGGGPGGGMGRRDRREGDASSTTPASSETNPSETKSSESKAGDAKPADAKPADGAASEKDGAKGDAKRERR